nr:DNA ligase [uncultured Albidiferax sp.]
MHTPPSVPLLRRTLLLIAAASAAPRWVWAEAPPLMLPKVYKPGIALHGYWVSEKYDGVRGYWDGKQLWTRGGQAITPPAWFTAGWPAVAMDGELWAGRGAFASAVSTVRQQAAADAAWRQMQFMVFDLPAHGAIFDLRLAALQELPLPPWVQPVKQSRIASPAALQALLHKTVQGGGEGLVLHRGESLYVGQRSDDLLKLKPFDDAEARVVGHIAGQGKYKGLLGALLVETPEGLRFKLGTGLSDAQRRDPPPVGSWVTYRFRDTNPSGIPRFASFLRLREEV